MLMSPVGFRSEKVCAAMQKLKSTDPTSRQRGRPTSTNPKLSKRNNQKREWEKLVAGPTWVLIPRLTTGRNITLTLTLCVV
jgi:hypothetical protein